jgi:hypothetical protein
MWLRMGMMNIIEWSVPFKRRTHNDVKLYQAREVEMQLNKPNVMGGH